MRIYEPNKRGRMSDLPQIRKAKDTVKMKKLKVIQKAVDSIAKRHKGRLDSIFKDWYGWEKWFQVELTCQLRETGYAFVEDSFSFDQKKKIPIAKINNSNAFVDIVYRHKGDLKEPYSAIEITLARTEQGLRKVLADLIKVRAIKNKEWSWRSVFAVFIFKRGGGKIDSKFSRILEAICDKYGVKKITSGEFDFLVFGWEPENNKTKSMAYSEYNIWLKGLIKLYEDERVKPRVSSKKKQQLVS